MKKINALLIAILVVTMVSESFAQVFGVKGGLNLSNQIIKDNDGTSSDDFKMNPGFHIGATAEFPLSDLLSFETGLLLSTKGYKFSISETELGQTVETKGSTNLLYLDIPITAKAYFDLSSVKVYGIVGPYIGIGLSGKSKLEMSGDGVSLTVKETLKWGSGAEDHYRRLDYGLIVGAGVAINSIEVGLTYGLGLANISAETDNGAKVNNRVLGITVGYKFGTK